MGIPDHLTCLLRNLYAGQEATVRTGHGTTDWFQIGKGVRQGCILSPCLFNFYAENIMRNAGLEETQAGIKIAGRNINNLRYSDDTTLMAESEEELKTLLMKVKEKSNKVGFKLNIQKTKIMASSPITSWQIDGETMEAMTVAQRLQVSAAVGAFLVGIAVSGPFATHAGRVIAPVRDLFAAVFFFFFGLQIAPAALLPVLPLAFGLVAVTAMTKFTTGWFAAGGADLRGRIRAGATLIARGEFSIVIASLAVAAGASPQVASLAAAYVLACAIIGPVAARAADPLASFVAK